MQLAVITWDGGSNREPFEMVCRGLLGRGAQVQVLSHRPTRALYEGLGATFHALPVGEKAERPTATMERERIMTVWLSRGVADAVAEMLTAHSFDLAIVDASMLTAFAACEVAATPFVVVHHTLPGAAWSGPRREQFEAFVPPVNGVRRSLGLPPRTGFGDVMSAAVAHIVPTAAALDDPPPWDLPLHYVGGLQPDSAHVDLPELPPRFVLVSFSTTWQRQIEALQATIDALAPLDRPVVVTTGPSVDPSELTSRANTSVFAQLPHRRLLHRVDAVVTHAGHGTILSALTAGVPLVCLPMGRDQHDVTRRVVAVGAGVEVDPANVEHDLLPALRRVLTEQRFAQGAAEVACALASHGGLEEALDIIETCARARRNSSAKDTQPGG